MSVPTNLRVPILAVEFNSDRAVTGPSTLRYNALLIGQRLATGVRAELVIDKVTSFEQAELLYGAGSQLSLMFRAFFKTNRTSVVYGVSLDDAATGVPAAGSFAITGTATAPGTFVAYIAGVRYPVAVTTGMTATQLGAALEALIDADSRCPASAANTTGTVAITAKNDGEAGNDIDLRINHIAGEELPAGISCTVTAMSAGANNPTIQNVIDILGDQWYNVICAPYYDTTSLTAIETELADRFGPLRMIDGMYVTSRRGSVGTLTAFGAGRNSKHVICIHSEAIPGYSAEFAAEAAGAISEEMQNDPALPMRTVSLPGILPPDPEDQFTISDNNDLLYNGISTFYVDSGGVVRLQRVITMYQTNPVGADDVAYLKAETMFSLMYMRYDFRSTILRKYPRAKLADDGVRVGPGQVVMTPMLGKAEAINIFRGWEEMGLVENFDQFADEVECYRSLTDRDRLEWVLPPDLINQFYVGAASLQFIL